MNLLFFCLTFFCLIIPSRILISSRQCGTLTIVDLLELDPAESVTVTVMV
jgi:hypothetical protein